MITRMKYILIILLTGFAHTIIAQRSFTLNDAVREGLANNFEIQIEKKTVDIAGIQNSWGNAGMWPSVSLRIGMDNSLNDRFNETNQTGAFTGAVQANWTLFDGFAVRIRKHRLEQLEALSGGNAAVVIENTIQAIILGYHKVLLEQERLDVLKQVMDLSKDRYDYITHRAELGAGSTFEVSQAKGDYLTDKTNYLNQEMNVRSSKRILSILMALPPESEFELTSELEASTQDYQLASVKEKMLANNRTLKNQYLNLTILDQAIALERSGRYPTLSLGTGISTTYYPDALNTNDNIAAFSGSYSLYANLSLSYNLFNGGMVNRNIEIAKINKAIGEVRTADMISRLTNQLFDFYDLYMVRVELFQLQQENLQTAQLNMDISTEKYRTGAISSFDFRNAQRTYLETAMAQLQSVYNLIETNTNLVRITGGMIDEEDAGNTMN